MTTRYLIEYREDVDGDPIDTWVFDSPRSAQVGLRDVVSRYVIVHDDDIDRLPDQPEFLAGSLTWYREDVND